MPPPPNPKRPTHASQKRQLKKLVKPFRSPLVNYEDVLAGKDGVYASGHVRQAVTTTKVSTRQTAQSHINTAIDQGQTGDCTTSSAKPHCLQNTPPNGLNSALRSTILCSSVRPSVLSAPTIQSLQARVQKLKQAIKIKSEQLNGDDDRKLETLVTKWRTVGREVAWSVWDTVKDLEPGTVVATGGGALCSNRGWDGCEDGPAVRAKKSGPARSVAGSWGLQAGWGYGDGKSGQSSDRWSWSEQEDNVEKGGECEMEDKMETCDNDSAMLPHSLGTMLRHMGIDPDTLRWDEDEGDFVDDT